MAPRTLIFYISSATSDLAVSRSIPSGRPAIGPSNSTGSCPSIWGNPNWVGPASIVNAHRFIFDSRDQGAAERMAILGKRDGVWRCRTIFNCTDACPRGIPVTDLIEQVKRAMVYGDPKDAV